MKIQSRRIPLPLQLILMTLALLAGGAYFLVDQQATPPIQSEVADWPWKVVTEGKIFLNGVSAGTLSDTKPLNTKIYNMFDLRLKRKVIDEYDRPSVLVVADPKVSFGRVADIYNAIAEGNGAPFLITKSSFAKLADGGKPNPLALVVTTEGIEPAVLRKLSTLKNGDGETAADQISISTQVDQFDLQYARTYETTIEIGSDGKYYINEQNGVSNVNRMQMNPNVNSPRPPVIPLRQRAISKTEMAAILTKAIDSSEEGHRVLKLIVSEKAAYERVLTIIETLNDPEIKYFTSLRRLDMK